MLVHRESFCAKSMGVTICLLGTSIHRLMDQMCNLSLDPYVFYFSWMWKAFFLSVSHYCWDRGLYPSFLISYYTKQSKISADIYTPAIQMCLCTFWHSSYQLVEPHRSNAFVHLYWLLGCIVLWLYVILMLFSFRSNSSTIFLFLTSLLIYNWMTCY